SAHIEIERCGQISRLRIGRKIDNPQIRLGVGIYWLRGCSDKRDSFAVWTQRQSIDSHVDRVEFCCVPTVWVNPIQFSLRQFVIRFVYAQRREIDLIADIPSYKN